MTRTRQELREATTRSTRRGGMLRGKARLVALTLLGLGIGLGNGGFAASPGNAGAHLARNAGLVTTTPDETAERVRAVDRTRPVPDRTLQAIGATGTRHECAGTTPTSAPNKVLVLRAMHVGSACGMGAPCSATKLYAPDNNRKSALSIVSSRNRATGGRYDDRTAKR